MERPDQPSIPKPRTPIKRPMAGRPTPVKRKPRKPNWVYVAGCVCLMAAFFMPWFTTPLGSVHGYEICYWVPRVLVALYAPDKLVLASNSMWALAFIGVFAFFGLGMELASLQKHKNQWWLRALTAASPVVAVLFIISIFTMASAEEIAVIARLISDNSGEERTPARSSQEMPGMGTVLWQLAKLMGWGAWVMLLGMLLCAISVPVRPGRKKPAAVAATADGASAPAA